MANIFNRLQFVKHEEVFPTREAAYNYLVSQEDGIQYIVRPSLLAEPMVLLYGDEENPNVILAIGSVGDGETASIGNRTFFIDFQKSEEEIAELDEKIEEAIKSLTLIPVESDTINLHSEKTDDGTYVSGDVKIASAQVISGISRDNKIKVLENEGLFLYVNVEYTEDGKLIFRVNDEVDEFTIPSVVSGEYVYEGDDAENIILTQNDGSKVKIDVGHLIDEWTVLPEDATPTPIVLNRAEVSGEPCPHGVEVWQDLLTADVRIKNEDDNILEKVNDGRELYVGGKAENIAYYKNNGDRSTVKEQLDRIKLNIDGENILTEDNNGFFASVKLDYVSEENKLVFVKTTVTGGTVTKNIELNSIEFLEDITYDPTTEEIVIRYVDNKGEHKQLRIPASFVIEEWKVDNENHSIELIKTRNAEDNKDVLTADAKIHSGDNNILEDKEHTLYVRGEADNIKYGNDSNVETEIDALKDSDSDINTRIDDEISRAEAAETVLTNKIGTGFTEDPHENVTFKFNELQTAISDEVTRAEGVDEQLQTAISDEVTRAEGVENSLSGAITTETSRAQGVEEVLSNKIGSGFTDDPHENVTFKFNELDGKIEVETNRAESIEREISATVISNYEILDNKISGITLSFEDTGSIDFTKSANNVVTANVILQGGDNMIKNVGSGLYATAHLSYDVATNKIKLTTSYGEDEFQLAGATVIDNLYYDDHTGEIVITYHDGSGNVQTVKFPASQLFNEWVVENPVQGSGVELTKIPHSEEGQPDKLSARVILSEHPDNALVIDGNGLYVSSSAMSESKEIAECANNKSDKIYEQLYGAGEVIPNCGEGSEYIKSHNSRIISGASSFQEADELLDAALYDIIHDWFLVGSDTPTNHVDFITEGQNRKALVDVRLSHGNNAYNGGQKDSELVISGITSTQFTDTNVIKYVDVKKGYSQEDLEPNNKYNGIYLSNIWNCGTLDSNGLPIDDYNGSTVTPNYNN